MIHFLWSIIFLFFGIVLVLLYIAVFAGTLLLAMTLWHLFREYRSYEYIYTAWQNTREWLKEQIPKWCQSKCILYVVLLVMAFNISIYLKQRVEWMGDDNGNLAAKEYWVAGQVVYAYRNIYCRLSSPEDDFIQPFHWLQEMIYKKGSQYLPENDGEIGVWTDIWFIYPYSRTFSNTKGVADGYNPAPKMMALVERTWFSLEKQATGEWADSQMKEQHYYRNFPGLAFYYIQKKGFLTGSYMGSQELLVQDAALLFRTQQLADWLGELPQKWQTSTQTQVFIQRHPKVEVMRQLTRLMETGDLIIGSIYKKEFYCEHPLVLEYIALRAEFTEGYDGNPVVNRMWERAQAKRLYNIAVNTLVGRFQNYILDRFCDIEVAGEEDIQGFMGLSSATKKHRDSFLEGTFNKEVKILEEIYYGR